MIDNYALPSSHPRPPIQPEWTSIKFSNDGDKILVTTSGDVHYVTDAYNTDMKRRLIGHVGLNNALQLLGGEETSWTPDGRFVVGGSIILYSTSDGFIFDIIIIYSEFMRKLIILF